MRMRPRRSVSIWFGSLASSGSARISVQRSRLNWSEMQGPVGEGV
jgi:hypothetical protein